MARPKKVIDYDMVKKLSAIFCTEEEIASVLGISVRTLQRDAEFCRIYKMGLDYAKTSLRRKQWQLAGNNASMAIFLGKNYLGQSDKIDKAFDEESEKTLNALFEKLGRIKTDD